MEPLRCRCAAIALLLLAGPAPIPRPAGAQEGAPGGEWHRYAGDPGSTKSSPLAQIDRTNVGRLEIAWRWRSPDNDVEGPRNRAFEATPLMVGGRLYTSTSFSQAAAIDAASGDTLWIFDPRSYEAGRPPNEGFLHRGVAYWSDGERSRILYATGDARLFSLAAATGRPDPGFGEDGAVDLRRGIPRLGSGGSGVLGVTSPPLVIGDLVVVGSSVTDGVSTPSGPPGDVRAYDVRSGELRWTFHTIPHPGEPGHATWEGDSWRQAGAANVWAPMSADEELGYLYLPVSCPWNNYYGGARLGDNLFANSLVCLEAETGKRVWHFQTIHHDIWDYDLASAPNLVDVVVDGEEIPAVAQVTKQGFTFVFDRRNGEPVWPIEELAVPASTVPGERTSPTQPRPTRPPPFTRQGVRLEDLVDFTPEQRAAAEEILNRYDWGPLFTPPSERGTVLVPGIGGGANWGGASVDPATGLLYVTALGSVPFVVGLGRSSVPGFYVPDRVDILTGPDEQFHLFKPPWNTVTAIDLNRGTIAWQVPNDGERGVAGIAASLVTGSLLFYGHRSEPLLRAFEKGSGDIVWEGSLPASATGAPMTYLLDGRQYVVVAVGEGDETTELVAWSLRGSPPAHPGTLELDPGAVAVEEGEGRAVLALRRVDGTRGRVSVEVVARDGSARAGEDYEAPVLPARTVSWEAGEAGEKRFKLAIVDDPLPEGEESLTVRLRRPTGGAILGFENRATVTVRDDDSGPCSSDAETLCLRDDRFAVTAAFRTAGGASGRASAVRLTSESGYFTFFDAGNIEVVVKVLDACGEPTPRFWVFAAGLTNLEVTLTVVDTLRGVPRTYTNPLSTPFAPILATDAFATCP